MTVTAPDGTTARLRERLGRGNVLVVLVAPGTGVWDRRHWRTAGVMPRLTDAVGALPGATELLVTESYPGASAHTVLLVRPDGHLVAAFGGVRPRELFTAALTALGRAHRDEPEPGDAEPGSPGPEGGAPGPEKDEADDRAEAGAGHSAPERGSTRTGPPDAPDRPVPSHPPPRPRRCGGALTATGAHGSLQIMTDTDVRLWRRVHMDLVRYAGCVCRPSC